MSEHNGLIPVTLAARRVGVSEPTLRRRLREYGVPIFTTARDRRQELVRIADLDALFPVDPKPMVPA